MSGNQLFVEKDDERTEGSYFQVKINSEKLNKLLEDFENRFEDLEQKHKLHELTLRRNQEETQNRIKKVLEKNEKQVQELSTKMSHNYEMQMHSLERQEKQINEKVLNAFHHIERLNVAILRSQDESKSQFLSYLKKTKTDIMGGQEPFIPSIKEIITITDKKITGIKDKLPSLIQQFYYLNQSKKAEEVKKNELNIQFYEIDSNNKQEQQRQNSKVLYPSKITTQKQNCDFRINNVIAKEDKKKSKIITRSSMQEPNRSEVSSKQYNDLVERIEKLEALEKSVQKNEIEFQKSKHKTILFDQKFLFITKKLQRYHQETLQLKSGLRRMECDKMDEKVIEEIRGSIKWVNRQLEEKLEKKCSKDQFLKEKNRINEKLSILYENMIQKADKGQIQKAIIFLEGKIKQLIFFVASEQSDQRDGAMIKSAIKCLSCDRDLERNMKKKEKEKQVGTQENSRNSLSIRAVSHRMKYRVQAGKRTKTQGNNIEGSCWNDT